MKLPVNMQGYCEYARDELAVNMHDTPHEGSASPTHLVPVSTEVCIHLNCTVYTHTICAGQRNTKNPIFGDNARKQKSD